MALLRAVTGIRLRVELLPWSLVALPQRESGRRCGQPSPP